MTGFYYAGAGDAGNRIRYAAHGAVEAMRLGNGLWEHASFNARLQPSEVGVGASAADSGVLRLTYSYGGSENNGNVRSQRIEAPGLDVIQTYDYDAVNRLLSAREAQTGGGADAWRQSYTYSDSAGRNAQFGNRWVDVSADPATGQVRTTANAAPQSNPQISPATNRFDEGQGYAYDGAGNLSQDPSHSYGYDGENRLAAVDGGWNGTGGANYSYDGEGHRVKKVTGAEATVFVYDAAGKLVAEYSNHVENNGTSYLTADTLGSTRVVTDNGGGVRSRHDYLPFGEEVGAGVGGRTTNQGYVGSADGVRQRYTSKVRDNETGLDFFGARYYASTQGRFTSPDPLLSSGSIYDPRTWNRYSYTLNNPLKYIDPLGLYEFDANATDEQKKRFRQAYQDVEKARDKFKVGSDKYNRLNDVLKAYGKEGDKNGVSVGFTKFTGKDKDIGGKTSPPNLHYANDGTVTASLTVTINTSVIDKRDELATVTAHEGQHVSDGQNFAAALTRDLAANGASSTQAINGPFNLNGYQREFRGYEITSFMLEAQGNNNSNYEGVKLWDSGWKEPDKATLKRTEAINKFLEKSSTYPNSRPSNPGRRYVEP